MAVRAIETRSRWTARVSSEAVRRLVEHGDEIADGSDPQTLRPSDPEGATETPPARGGHQQRPGAGLAEHPPRVEQRPEHFCSQRAAQVRPALGPVQAGEREAAAGPRGPRRVDTQGLEGLRALRAEVDHAAPRRAGERPLPDERL